MRWANRRAIGGETHGTLITFRAREALDAAAALRFLRERAPGERVGVIGVSLGGAAALLGPVPLAVDAMVLEAVYPTIMEAVENRLRIGSEALTFAYWGKRAPTVPSAFTLTHAAPEAFKAASNVAIQR